MDTAPPAHTAPTTALPTADRRRVATAAALASAVEWYDYFVFGIAAALVLGDLYFPSGSSTMRRPRRLRHLRRRLPRPPARRHRRRPPRRQARPQADAGPRAHPDGPGHHRHRPAPDVRHHRRRRPDPAGRPARRAGRRGRRAVGRRHAAGHRVRPRGQAWCLRQRRPTRRPHRRGDGQLGLPAGKRLHHGQRVRRVGLASPLPHRPVRARPRLVHPRQGRGDPRIPAGRQGVDGEGEVERSSRCARSCAATSARCYW